MSLPTHRGLGILGLAALLGVLGDALLRATPWGVNLPLWMGWPPPPDGPSSPTDRRAAPPSRAGPFFP